MGSRLGPILANIFRKLERAIIVSLSDEIKLWKRYIDGTIAFVKTDAIKYVLSSLYSYHGNIQFTMETEQKNQIPFVDDFLIRNVKRISTTVYHKVITGNVLLLITANGEFGQALVRH